MRWSPGAAILLLALSQVSLPAAIAFPLSLILAARTRYPRYYIQLMTWGLAACGGFYLHHAITALTAVEVTLPYREIAAEIAAGLLIVVDGAWASIASLPKKAKKDADGEDYAPASITARTQDVPMSAGILCWIASTGPLLFGESTTVRFIAAFCLLVAALSIYISHRDDLADIGLVQTIRWTIAGCGATFMVMSLHEPTTEASQTVLYIQGGSGFALMLIALAAFIKQTPNTVRTSQVKTSIKDAIQERKNATTRKTFKPSASVPEILPKVSRAEFLRSTSSPLTPITASRPASPSDSHSLPAKTEPKNGAKRILDLDKLIAEVGEDETSSRPTVGGLQL